MKHKLHACFVLPHSLPLIEQSWMVPTFWNFPCFNLTTSKLRLARCPFWSKLISPVYPVNEVWKQKRNNNWGALILHQWKPNIARFTFLISQIMLSPNDHACPPSQDNEGDWNGWVQLSLFSALVNSWM